MTENGKKNCFTIMPFGGFFDRYYPDIYVEAIKEAGLNHKRVDDLYKAGSIINDIWDCTKEADIILADLTGKNPNVFYELGLAHAIAKPAILIAESMSDVPFDLKSLRVLTYNKNDSNWGEKLKKDITRAIKETIKEPEETILPTFLDTSKTKKLSVSSQEKDLLEMKSDINSIKRELKDSRANSYDTDYLSIGGGTTRILRNRDNHRLALYGNNYSLGRVNIMSLPISSIGLSSGELWNDGGIVKVV